MVDVSGTAGTIFGIAGMGIGLGLLAHTARNVSGMTDEMYDRPQQRGLPRRAGYGRMDGSQRGRRSGGRRRNYTSTCRHPGQRRSTTRRSTTRSTPTMYQNYWGSW